jgi:hypothetical protein
MKIHKRARPTLTALEVQHGDEIFFTRLDGSVARIRVVDSGAAIVHTTLAVPGVEESAATTVYRFHADIEVEGQTLRMEREVGSQRSFYEPWEVAGLRIWLDAVDAIFDFMRETHGPCRLQVNASHALPPRRQVRLALQDSKARICPDKVHAWCPLPAGGLRIEDCYRGEDCWMGAYDGASAHGGLDINHAKGTPLFLPIAVDDQFLFNSKENGSNNNRWRALRHWPDGSQWILQTAHMIRLTVPERQPLAAGTHYADGAGVWIGAHAHTHFAFAIFQDGELIRLDPWILFWQMYRDA